MKTLYRQLHQKIDKTLKRGKSILLLGARQTGKTTLAKELKADQLINFMDPQIRQRYEINPGSLIAEVRALKEKKGNKPLIILDEVQKVPVIMDSVQVLIDEKTATFFITGSSARKIRNLLPGRVIKYQLDPLTIRERPHQKQKLDHLLLNGSLPGLMSIKKQNNIDEELNSYVGTYLEEEIRKEALVRNLAAFANFLKLACIESGNLVHFRKLSQEIGIAHSTIAEYYRILEDCMLVERFEPITKSKTRKRLTKTSKYILFDLGIRRSGAKEGSLLPVSKMGQLFEQFVGLEVRRLTRILAEPVDIKFWRDHSGPEVDWVIEKSEKYIPIEVKWTNSPTIKEARHLLTFIHEYRSTEKGYIVCQTPNPLKLSDQITAIPWQHLPELINNIL